MRTRAAASAGQVLRPYGVAAVLGAVGLLVGGQPGCLTRGARDEGAHDLGASLESTTHPSTGWAALARLAVLGVVSLGFGAALGPEAPLIAIVTGLAANLRGVLHLARDEAVRLSVSAALGVSSAPRWEPWRFRSRRVRRLARKRVQRVAPSLVAAVAGLWVLLGCCRRGRCTR